MRPRQNAPIAHGVVDLTTPPTTAVYRAYDQRGELLYVGAADRLEVRLAQHRHTSEWFPLAATVEWETYATRAQALEVERQLIEGLAPPYNTAHNKHRDWLPTTARERHEMARAVSPVAAL